MPWAESYSDWNKKMKDYPILSKMDEGRVFSFGETKDGTFYFEEGCDCCFGVELTKDEAMQLADEIRRFVDSKKEPRDCNLKSWK